MKTFALKFTITNAITTACYRTGETNNLLYVMTLQDKSNNE